MRLRLVGGDALSAAVQRAGPAADPLNYAVNLAFLVLFAAFLGQSWNLAGEFAGQMSFGHAVFFGTGAYASTILHVTCGWSPWLAWPFAIAAGAAVGAGMGALSFRAGLRGSYFALVTLAFAEAFRILANSVPFTRGGLGMLIKSDPRVGNFQFRDPIWFYYLALALCTVALALAWWLTRSRFGARLAAIRENEDAAMALGINVFREKVLILAVSGGLCAAGGTLYAQKYLYIDPSIAFGVDKSIEMLLVSMIGGAGTIFGPLIGAGVLHFVGEVTRELGGTPARNQERAAAGADRIWHDPGGDRGLPSGWTDGVVPPPQAGATRIGAMLEVHALTKRFGGLTAVDSASLDVPEGAIVGLIGPNGAGKTTLFATVAGFHKPDGGRVMFLGHDITGLPPDRICARGMVRTFQNTQPFARLSVLENIMVGAYLRTGDRRHSERRAAEIGKRVGLADRLGAMAIELTVAGCKRLELARALATEPRLLLLDEVIAGLNPTEIAEIVDMVRAIRASGVTILMIEHVMQAVMSLAEDVFVLNDGRIIARGPPEAITSDRQVMEAYLGHGAAERLLAGAARA